MEIRSNYLVGWRPAFTLLELMISIGIIGLMAMMAIPVYHTMRDNVALGNSTQEVVSSLRVAQHRSLASQGNVNHGVHFETTSYTLFGDNWATATYKVPYNLINGVTITAGAGSDVIFTRLTGLTAAQQIQLRSKNGKVQTITIGVNGTITSP